MNFPKAVYRKDSCEDGYTEEVIYSLDEYFAKIKQGWFSHPQEARESQVIDSIPEENSVELPQEEKRKPGRPKKCLDEYFAKIKQGWFSHPQEARESQVIDSIPEENSVELPQEEKRKPGRPKK